MTDGVHPVDPLGLDPVDPLGAAKLDDEPAVAEAAITQRTVFKILIGVAWMYGGRGVGLLFTLALLGRLGIGDYGLYTMAFAFATIVGPTVDNPWAVRVIRESEERFVRERASRYLVGVTLMAAGAALIPFTFIGFFGLLQAGGELAFNCWLSRDIRDGHPERVFKWTATRQIVGVALACIYLFAVHHPTVQIACLLYCVPYLVIAVCSGFVVRGHRPGWPGNFKLMAILMGEMLFGTTLYLQGDVLLLGWLTNSTIVGYYSIGLIIAGALAGVGQSFVMTYHEPLRKSGGDLSAGPKLRTTLSLAAALAIVEMIVGVGVLLSPAAPVIGYVMLIVAGFAAFRTVIVVFQVILYAQHRDRLRFLASVSLIPVKFALLALLVWMGLGAIGAAITTTVADAALLAVFSLALYGKWKVPAR